ncbi:MAG TPA: Zn-ribbon domain-containing OB-fold protein [Amycolatopsis sp.]|uniref:Zn-ribbon domain-containing OB-fold protein n=1 Tax=Amycolatopsis sp. TaxID=37632 RepID=UPI002B460829|nr:Zn-ribbon domain-containing OB-fold protein [Amycolatopsis sp.]HKS46994.1 Zn-ribbon domain-containing OB-fold protein [Amycolatopsis sp.]
MATDSYDFLLAEADSETQPWWDAVRRHELVIQACAGCGALRHPPRSVCAECGSEQREWRRMSGTGTIYSFVVVHRPTLPMWRDSVPYNVVMVALDDAPHIRLHGNVVGIAEPELSIGMKVVATFDEVTESDTLLRWKPAPPRGGNL